MASGPLSVPSSNMPPPPPRAPKRKEVVLVSDNGDMGFVLGGELPRRLFRQGNSQRVSYLQEEDDWTSKIEAIIERDFFPELAKLQSKVEWLQVGLRAGAVCEVLAPAVIRAQRSMMVCSHEVPERYASSGWLLTMRATCVTPGYPQWRSSADPAGPAEHRGPASTRRAHPRCTAVHARRHRCAARAWGHTTRSAAALGAWRRSHRPQGPGAHP